MHAVFVSSDGAGFSVSGIGALTAPGPPLFALLLILFLRLVDAGSQDDLAGTLLDVQPREVQVARPRRPQQHGCDLGEVLVPYREYRSSGPVSPLHGRSSTPSYLLQTPDHHLVRRHNLPRNHPLYGPQRYLQTQLPRRLP